MHHRVGHLLGQGGAVHQHGVDAAGLGNQRHDGAVFRSEGAVDDFGDLRGAGEDDARHARRCHQRRTHGFARAVQQLQRTLRHPGSMQEFDRFPRHARRLLGRFGQHGIARGQRGGHLAYKDRQWKIPRADADPRTARDQAQRVGFPRDSECPTRHGDGLHDALGFICVIAQEIHRLTHFACRIAPRLEGFLDQQGTKPGQLLRHRVGRIAQHCRALRDVRFMPLAVTFIAGLQTRR